MSLFSKLSIWVMALMLAFIGGIVVQGFFLSPQQEIPVEENKITLRLPKDERAWRRAIIRNSSERVLLLELEKMKFYQDKK